MSYMQSKEFFSLGIGYSYAGHNKGFTLFVSSDRADSDILQKIREMPKNIILNGSKDRRGTIDEVRIMRNGIES